MMFKTHLAFGFLAALFLVQLFNIPNPILFIFLVTIFSGLPDIDHPGSIYGKKLFFISIPISIISKHRGILHSIFPPLAIFFILSNTGYAFLGLAIFAGYLTHLLCDALTKEGINFLNPILTFEIRGPIKTGTMLESVLFYFIIAADIFYILKLSSLI